jgi:hypothetical protein
VERAARILLSLAASSLAVIPVDATVPAAAAEASVPAPALARAAQMAPPVRGAAFQPASQSSGGRWIERAPEVELTSDPLEFGFAVVDWLLGG